MAQYLLLQGTLEQTTYASMVAWHASTYLRLQDHRPNLQRGLMQTAYLLMTVTKVITFPQKFAPAGFALYWLTRSKYLDSLCTVGFSDVFKREQCGMTLRAHLGDVLGSYGARSFWCSFSSSRSSLPTTLFHLRRSKSEHAYLHR